MSTTALEKENLEAHVDLCEQRYKNLETRMQNIESKVEHIHRDISRSKINDQSYYWCRWHNSSRTIINHSRNFN